MAFAIFRKPYVKITRSRLCIIEKYIIPLWLEINEKTTLDFRLPVHGF